MIVHCIDTETTGLYPHEGHEIVELAIITAAVNLDRRQPEIVILDELVTKVSPAHLELAHPVALEVNGYNELEWMGAPTFDELIDAIRYHTSQGPLMGWNVGFDVNHINQALLRAGQDTLSCRSIDVMSVAQAMLWPLGLRSMSLRATRQALGVSLEGSHRAYKDALDTLEIYGRLLSLSWLDRMLLKRRLSAGD